ncbi:MAG: hypothetical protein Q9173_001296 [Seirophora scorigena]
MEHIRGHLQSAGVATSIGILHAIRKHYPDRIVVQTPRKTGLLEFAEAGFANASLDTDSEFYASRRYTLRTDGDEEAGLKDEVELARYVYQWKGEQFILYATHYEERRDEVDNHYILGPQADAACIEGRSTAIDELIAAAALHGNRIDDEIWVYDRGYWRKNRKLWENVQACKWEQVILDDEMKANLIIDVEGFFDRKEDYTSFGVPWKRGIILHGLPGNGKTISIKSLMRSLSGRSPPIPTLYVKSLGRGAGHEDIREIFDKARETAPCLVVFEDIDSLVSDRIKSFFLNEIDGLEGNDGIMMIGSTNYLDRLDPGISKRPSRFDRKYHFALPAISERTRYCDYWRSKLAKRSSLELHPNTSIEIAKITEGFSFAYLQEVLVTALLELVQTQRLGSSGSPGPDQILQSIKKQVKMLRKEIRSSRKSVEDSGKNSVSSDPTSSSSTSIGFG